MEKTAAWLFTIFVYPNVTFFTCFTDNLFDPAFCFLNAAIPYNVWQYYQTTGDMDFLAGYGAEIILSTALFWSDIAEYNPKRDRYEIRGVMGPDEYHTSYPDSDLPGLNNNAYTNFMAVWVLQCASDLLNLFDNEFIEDIFEKTK